MATELGKAYVQIVPSSKGISGSISSALGGEATAAGQSAGLNIVGAIKGVIAAAGIGAALKSALDAGGALQQSYGGLETIYGQAAEGAKKYATEAAKAGISANSYAEQAVSFGAALKQAYSGDTAKAMEAANVAILDMADNSAKMGTDITSIQNAYQGFAKQNYTMLDNLKLGYGGTKKEMERLLEDATALSGVEYDIENLGDVYDAIHVIQQDLGLTGVAAAEASTTFTGSMGAMKAAAENLLANLALGEDITEPLKVLVGNAQVFFTNNMLPMIENIFNALPILIGGVKDALVEALNLIGENAGEIASQGVEIVMSLVEAIIEAAPELIVAAASLIAELGKAFAEVDWLSLGTQIITALHSAINEVATAIFGSDNTTLDSILQTITDNLPRVLDKGIEIVTNLADGIFKKIPDLMLTVATLMNTILEFLLKNMPVLMEKGYELIKKLAEGFIKSLPEIATSVGTIFAQFGKTFIEHLPEILEKGIELIGKLITGMIKAIPQLIAAIPKIIDAVKDVFEDTDWGEIGWNLIEGIGNGILNAAGMIADAARDAAQSAFDAACDWLGISSPAKKGIWMGEMLDEGMALGIKDSMDEVTDATNDAVSSAFDALKMPQTSFNIGQAKSGGNLTLNMTINAAEGMDVEYLAEVVQNKITTAVNQRELVYA